MIDTRENAKVTLIDLAGDQYTTGGPVRLLQHLRDL